MNSRCGRIISGKYKGKKIPLSGNVAIRPTTDRVKETVFNILQHYFRDNMTNGVILDLFAGSGSLGIECISRGASKIVFVDKNKQVVTDIKNFVDSLNLSSNIVEYLVGDATNINFSNNEEMALNLTKEKITLVFLDPPYKSSLIEDSLNSLLQQDIFRDDCVFITESSIDLEINNLKLKQTKIIGKTIIKIYMLN